jgi:transcriptional regulator with XRE-family HTH domain
MTRDEVAEQTGINEATLYRIETARARPQTRTLTALLKLYGLPEDEWADLLALARQASEQSWLQSFPDELPEPYRAYISFEGEARSLTNYECLFVPGLLQTEDYARAALRAGTPTATATEIDRLLVARMNRQAVLTRDPPMRLWAIVDEGALHRQVGGPDVMRDQLKRLVEVAALPHVTLQAIPYAVGAHPGMAGSFAVLQFAEPSAGDVVYVESQAADLFLESPTDVNRFTRIVEHLRALALPPEATASLAVEIAGQLSV